MWIWLVTTMIVLAAIYMIAFTIIMNNVKENVIQQNSDIEHIHEINRIGTWGEWFSEYVLIVERNGQKFRIWTNGDGKITDQEVL
jgi:hypothetical protein